MFSSSTKIWFEKKKQKIKKVRNLHIEHYKVRIFFFKQKKKHQKAYCGLKTHFELNFFFK